jgi:ubiquinone/menaquinone biosynthesis C-methylase UbiE
MKQLDIPELLDTDSGTAEEITNALLDIRDINRRFGGVSTMQSLVERVAKEVGRTSFTVLEVAAGAGYVPQAAGERLKRRGIHLQITLLDRAQSHLPEKTSEDSAFHHAIVGDALALPFPDSSFDLVGCSLFAHHLVADDLLKFVNEGLRVCRNAVLINDIVRHPVHLALVYAGMPSFRSRLTRNDAVVSVRRAFTPGEMAALLKKTSAARIEIQRQYLFRMGVIVWKNCTA